MRRLGLTLGLGTVLLSAVGCRDEVAHPGANSGAALARTGSQLAAELYDYEIPPPPPPKLEPPPPPLPAPVRVEVPAPPPPAPDPLPPPEPQFEDPAPMLRAMRARELRALRRQASAAQLTSLQSPAEAAPAPVPGAWRLKDPDYKQRDPKLGEDKSTLPVDRFRVITADRYINAILENSVNSQIPGRIIAIVERHVFGADGRLPLLPKGSRIICQYESLAKAGDSRLNVKCSRALRPDGASVLLTDAQGADQMARTGLVGDVDLRMWERYGSAFVVSALSALAASSQNVSQNQTVTNAGNALSQNLGQVTAKVLEQSVDLAPIVTVAAGSRIQIIPNTDIWIREPLPPGTAASQ
jgi:type IV secretion system protein VirB10